MGSGLRSRDRWQGYSPMPASIDRKGTVSDHLHDGDSRRASRR
jgi:hypothetical protein